MPVKGEVWERDGRTIEWVRYVGAGEVITSSAILVDGIQPNAGDLMPKGFFIVRPLAYAWGGFAGVHEMNPNVKVTLP